MGQGFQDLANDLYRSKVDHISISELKAYSYSPYKYKYEILDGISKAPPSKSQSLGTLFHTALLEPDIFEKNVEAFSDLRVSAALEAKNKGVFVCRKTDYNNVLYARAEVLKNEYVRSVLQGAKCEASVFWEHPLGVKAKCRFDSVNVDKKIILDVKTCQSLDRFRSQVKWYGYDMQAAFYTDCAKQVTGDDYVFQFLVCEMESPYLYKIYEMSPELLKEARNKYEEILLRYKHSIETGYFPHPAEQIEMLYPNNNLYEVIEEI